MTAAIGDSSWLAAQVTGGLWRRVDWVSSTGSTNADLVAAARAGEPGGRVLIADFQDAGRGRFDRSWQAPPGGTLALSVLVRPRAVAPSRWSWLPLVTGLAVADGLREATGLDTALKWPNDVLVGGRKICGILVERVGGARAVTTSDEARLDAAVAGLGINTTMTSAELPVPTATSLAVEGVAIAPGVLAAAVLRAFEGWYTRWEGGEDLVSAYAARCASIGREVRVVVSPVETFEGRAMGVDAGGRLLVRAGDDRRVFSAGDVWHLR